MDVLPVLRNWSAGTGPMYSRLAHAMRSAIERGELPGGTRLPPERPLAEALEVSRTTVVLAYQRLRDEGLVESRQGSGTWVPRRGVPTAPDEILITTGAQQAIDLVARLLVPRDANVVLEDPTYLGAIDVFALAGARLVPVPVGTTGVALCNAIEAATPVVPTGTGTSRAPASANTSIAPR